MNVIRRTSYIYVRLRLHEKHLSRIKESISYSTSPELAIFSFISLQNVTNRDEKQIVNSTRKVPCGGLSLMGEGLSALISVNRATDPVKNWRT